MKQQREEHFWNVDLVELFRDWFSQIALLCQTGLAFVVMSLPVVIPAFIMWWAAGFPNVFILFNG